MAFERLRGKTGVPLLQQADGALREFSEAARCERLCQVRKSKKRCTQEEEAASDNGGGFTFVWSRFDDALSCRGKAAGGHARLGKVQGPGATGIGVLWRNSQGVYQIPI